ncbi:ecto-ADP-ribosyltransferase 4-like [Mugil cephalus]|uniref:ecto-ADP-ribosyltransferase 4-like n=1 Tax=Mugil cephalus TaxID=48193 RepID=UPI001FB6CB2B|nr:ecto-ADP-ribosyltransferase 4-like [Mugil cephalus]
MLKDNVLIFMGICCLCVKIKPLHAKTWPLQDSIVSKASDVQKLDGGPAAQETIQVPQLGDPGVVQNISNQTVMQKTTNDSLKSSDASIHLFTIPLSLSPDSVDDMYYGCSHNMLIKVKRDYLPKSTNDHLYTASTTLCAHKAMKNKDIADLLSLDHFRALCAYTAGAYADLNRAVRKGKTFYRNSFEFHALHFLLSDAIRLLKLNQGTCFTTYRRSRRLFSSQVGQTIRFGSFASSSLSNNLTQFGRRTCFDIRTCYGAYLKSYSEFDSDEDEVLIPPYEMFNIVSVDMSGDSHLHCDVVYKLETAGIYSSLNCQAVDL